MAFDPKRHVIKVQGGREYLPVSARLVWFRSEHPDWGIVTQAVEINLEKQYAIFSCTIFNEEGRVMATATKMENVKGFGDFIEKAETGSVGRALAMCGYGTQFAPELEDGPRFVGAASAGNRYQARQNVPPPAPARSAPVDQPPASNGMNSRPAAPPPQAQPMPSALEDDSLPPPSRPAPTPVNRVPERPAADAPITRVREPERDLVDPGGDFEDEEDPFGDEGEAPSGRPPAPPRAVADPAPRRAPAELEARSDAQEKEKNSLPRCSVEGCANVLTSGQHTMSMQKFGKPICLMHQRDPAIVGATNGARRNAL